jgi:hypothetical protein
MASKLSLQLFRATVGWLKSVVEEQLIASPQISAGKDKNAPVLFVCFAVWLARMINPSCFIAAYCRIDHIAVVKREEHCVIWILRIVCRQLLRLLPGYALSGVFNDPLSLVESPRGENSFSMHGRPTHNHWIRE